METADSAEAALALVEFAGVLAADRLLAEVPLEPIADERDGYHQAVALANPAQWINKMDIAEAIRKTNMDVAEAIRKERERLG